MNSNHQNEMLKHVELKGKRPGDMINFQYSYCPMAPLHFDELNRLIEILNSFEGMTDKSYNSILYMISNDYDGLSEGEINNTPLMDKYLNCPISLIPGLGGDRCSYIGQNNQTMVDFLCENLSDYNTQVKFISSTEYYQSGKFNNLLVEIFDKHDEIKDLMEEFKSDYYSPFMPVFHDSIKQSKIPWVNDVQADLSKTPNGRYLEYTIGTTPCISTIEDGYSKLQNDIDISMKWAYFDIDCEIFSRSSYRLLSSKINNLIGGCPPYEAK